MDELLSVGFLTQAQVAHLEGLPSLYRTASAQCRRATSGQPLPDHAAPNRKTNSAHTNAARPAGLITPTLQLVKSPSLRG